MVKFIERVINWSTHIHPDYDMVHIVGGKQVRYDYKNRSVASAE